MNISGIIKEKQNNIAFTNWSSIKIKHLQFLQCLYSRKSRCFLSLVLPADMIVKRMCKVCNQSHLFDLREKVFKNQMGLPKCKCNAYANDAYYHYKRTGLGMVNPWTNKRCPEGIIQGLLHENGSTSLVFGVAYKISPCGSGALLPVWPKELGPLPFPLHDIVRTD